MAVDESQQYPRIPHPLLNWEELNRRTSGFSADVLERLERLSHLAQMVVLNGSVPVSPGGVLLPYTQGFNNVLSANLAAGTITVPETGVYDFYFYASGAVGVPGTVESFAIRNNGTPVLVIDSTQAQSAEGVEASVSSIARVENANAVIDAQLTATSSSSITLTNMVLAIGYRAPIENMVALP